MSDMAAIKAPDFWHIENLAYNAPLSDGKVFFLIMMPVLWGIKLLALGLCDCRGIWICLNLHDAVAGARSYPFGGSGAIAADQLGVFGGIRTNKRHCISLVSIKSQVR
jgi:hypothetical protein